MNHTRSTNLAIAMLLVTQISCQFITGLGGGGDSGYYTEPGNPIDVSITLDAANVTQVISTDGGEMSVTGTDGTRYTLAIPSGALFVDTEISMTPIASISNLPFTGGLGGAVKLEPSGLNFFDFVTLTIEPANPVPPENQVLFGFEEDGEDLHLAIPGADSTKIQIRLLTFSGAGVANGVSAEKAGVMQRSADRAEVRLTNQVAEYLQNQRNGQSPDPSVVADASIEFYNSVVVPRLKAAASASGTCADAKKALQTYLAWERQRQLLGVASDGDKFGEVVKDFVPIMAKKCFDEEFDRCANKHMIAGMIPTLLQFERMGQLLGAFSVDNPALDNKAWAEARAYGESLTRKCFQWELEFESAGTFEDKEGISYDSRVKAKVPIRMEGETFTLKLNGKSALNNVDFTFRVPECSVTSNRGGGEFVVDSLSWETVLRKDSDGENRFFVKDFFLKYSPGKTSESAVIACPESPALPTPPGPLWTALFISTHYKEVDQGGGQAPGIAPGSILAGDVPADAQVPAYLAKHWTAYEAELMATKEWQGNSDLDAAVFEGGEFRLNHRPQK